MYCFINERMLREEEAGVSVRDLAVQRGYGVFDFFRLTGNRPLFLQDHLNRLWHSAEGLRLAIPVSRNVLEDRIAAVIQKNDLPDSGIRITVTGGTSADGYTPAVPTVIVTQHTFHPPSADAQQHGIVLATYNHQRQLPQYKTIDYLMAVWLQPWARDGGADDILYQHNNEITECPRSNVFAVLSNKTIVTPAENVLHGITRNKILQLASTQFKVEERPLLLNELYMAKEVFITSTTKGILPVRKVDLATFATGPGTVTHGLAQRFEAHCAMV